MTRNPGTLFVQKRCQNFLQKDTSNTRLFWTVVVALAATPYKWVNKFAKYSDTIYSFDIDKEKLVNLCHNATIYKVLDKIQTINMDVLDIKINGFDMSFSSPAWGGMAYNRKNFSLLK